jgi:hypothetical protein
VSNDILSRVVRRRVAEQSDELSVVSINDIAFGPGQTYGTIVCDLERRKPVTLLPDRALDTLELGSLNTLRYRPSPATVAAVRVRRSRRRCPMLIRLPIAGNL